MTELNNKSFLKKTVGILFPAIRPGFKDLTSSMVDDARGTKNFILNSIKISNETESDRDLMKISDRKERFSMALKMNGKTEKDLPIIEASAGRMFEAYAMLTLFAFLWMFIAPALGLASQSGWRIADIALPLGLVILLSAKSFSWSVTLYRIQRRSMVTVREYFQDPNAWLGGKPRITTTVLTVVLALGLGWLFPAPALAQTANAAVSSGIQGAGNTIMSLFTNAGADDLSLNWLRRLFPRMANLACAGGATSSSSCESIDADILGTMMGSFNSILLGFASVIMAWHAISGTVATAHSGKVMGDRWHTIWAPIRMVVGFGLLVPIKGYCGAQFIMLMVIILGYNMANVMWSSYVEKALSGELSSVATSISPNMGIELAHSVLASTICVSVLEKYRDGLITQNPMWKDKTRSVIGLKKTRYNETNVLGPSFTGSQINDVNGEAQVATATTITDGADNSTTMIANINPVVSKGLIWDFGTACGVLRAESINTDNLPANENAASYGQSQNDKFKGTMNSNNTNVTVQFAKESNAAYLKFIASKNTAIINLMVDVDKTGLAKLMADTVSFGSSENNQDPSKTSDLESKYNDVRKAGLKFDATISREGSILADEINKSGRQSFIERAKSLGWPSAGALNSTLVRASARISEIISQSAPVSSIPNLQEIQNVVEGKNGEAFDNLKRAFQYTGDLIRDRDQRGSASPSAISLGSDMQGSGVLSNMTKTFSNSLLQGLAGRNGLATLDPVHPMGDIQKLGNTMLTSAYALLGVWIGLKGGSVGAAHSMVGLVGGAVPDGILQGLAPFAWTIMVALFACGILHAYILPMLPFILWFYAIIGIISLAVELIIAAAVAAFMHIRADGQELINQEQKAIWTMGFNALLRPSLLLFGLVLSNIVLSVGASFLNNMYGVAVTTTNGDTVIGFTGLVAMTVMAFYLHYQLVVRSMHLVTAIPAIVSEVLGARDQSRGEMDEKTKFFGAIGNINRSAVNVTTGLGQGLLVGTPRKDPDKPMPNATS